MRGIGVSRFGNSYYKFLVLCIDLPYDPPNVIIRFEVFIVQQFAFDLSHFINPDAGIFGFFRADNDTLRWFQTRSLKKIAAGKQCARKRKKLEKIFKINYTAIYVIFPDILQWPIVKTPGVA